MSKSNTFENEILAHIFNNANIANIGDATGLRGSTAAGSLYLSLHTADPGEAGTAATNEISYTGYARAPVARSSAGFTVSGNTVTLTANVDFPKMTGGTGGTITHFAVVKEVSGASVVCYKGPVSPTILAAAGIIPRLETGTNIVED
jgi:hydroxymethylglutaryl-CoA reductase